MKQVQNNDRVTSITNQIDRTTHISEQQITAIEEVSEISKGLNELVSKVKEL